MTFYVDTSVLVASLTAETATLRAQRWLSAQAAGSICMSEWTITEFSAALSIKLRTRQLDAGERKMALAAFSRHFVDAIEILPVARSDFRTAAELADASPEGLRSGDALHLAVCMRRGLGLCTLDQRLARASAQSGVESALP